mmetsp:Transcript_12686/g.21699  ORF Transcript_12686/g.21699 Transcript_12686/m.21699 type:complete len:200 (+) Transcript_12686:144-743(+)
MAIIEKTIGGEKNGQKRKVERPKQSKYYPADDLPVAKPAHVQNPAKLRKTLVPGTVLIVLAGRFRGKRVVMLKQLVKSGTLLITGPYAINGVPLRRIDSRYVVATSTKIDVSKVDVSKFDDAYFKKAKTGSKKSEKDFFKNEQGETVEKKKTLPDSFKSDQKAVDASIVAALKKDPLLKCYIKARFSLTKGQAPHEMLF